MSTEKTQLDDAVWDAWGDSFLGAVPDHLRTEFVAATREMSLKPGEEAHDAVATQVILAVEGLLRIFFRRPNGRQATARYLRPGDTYGLASAFITEELGVYLQAMTPSRIVVIDVQVLRRLVESNNQVAQSVIRDLSTKIVDQVFALESSTFLSIRQKVAQHLLDLAIDFRDGHLHVEASQQDIADAIGSVREVAARALAQFRAEGLISGGRNQISILDPSALHRVTHDAGQP